MTGQTHAEAEWALVGNLLHEPSRFHEIEVSQNDFSQESCKQIYSAINQLIVANEPVDIITVSSFLEKTTGKKWTKPIGEIMQRTKDVVSINVYARMVREATQKREAVKIASVLIENCKTDPDAVSTAIQDLMRLGETERNYECNLQESLGLAVEELDALHHSEKLPGITTGLIKLNEFLGGYHDTDLIIVAARPAMGKTAFALNAWEKSNVPTGFISTEQAREQIATRLLSINGMVDSQNIRSGKLTEQDWVSVTGAINNLHERKLWINDKARINIDEVSQQARKWKFNFGIEMLLIDYVQRIEGDKKLSRHEQIDDIVKGLKSLAKELKIPVIALAQVNRNVETRTNKRPFMSDIKDSGSIEQEADIILSIYRDEVYNSETRDIGIAEISTLKNRHGPTGGARVNWDGQHLRFDDLV